MIPLLTREAVRAIDADAIERLGVPGLVLMENAGAGASDALVRRFPGALRAPLIVGGPGQNGGDGWVVADATSRHGTFVNGARVTRQRLRDGDQLQGRIRSLAAWLLDTDLHAAKRRDVFRHRIGELEATLLEQHHRRYRRDRLGH